MSEQLMKALAGKQIDEATLQKMLALLQEKPAKKRADNVQAKKPKPVIADPNEIIEHGKHIASFNLQLVLKNHGHTTKLVTMDYASDGMSTRKEIATALANKYVSETYHDSEVDIVGISKVSFKLKKDVAIREVRAREGHPMQYKMFPEDLAINKNKGECVLDMIMTAAAAVWPTYTRQQLIEELAKVAEKQDDITQGITTRHIMAWAKAKTYVTCIALSPFLISLDHVIATKTKLTLAFIVNNNHVYPITDPALKLHVAKTKKLDFTTMQFSAGDEDWCYRTLEQLSLDQPMNKIVHVETDDLCSVLKDVVIKTGYNPVAIMSNGPFVTAFQHPVTNQIYIASQDFLQRKEVAEKSFEETNYIGFLWANQSWAELWNAWVQCSIGELQPSSYSGASLLIREIYHQGAYIGMTREVSEEEESQVVSYDMTKCYTSCLLENKDPFAIESVFDNVVERPADMTKLPVGKAYVSQEFYLGKAKYSLGFYPSFFVQYCLDTTAITLDQITHIQTAARDRSGSTFRSLVEKLQEKFPVLAKRMINPGVGAWGKRFSSKGSVAITDSFEVALGMVAEDSQIALTEVGSFWFMRKESKELLYQGHVPLREHIVCMGHIKLHQMEQKILANGGEVIAYNTDSVKVIGATYEAVDKAVAKPGDICLEGKCNLRGQLIPQMRNRRQWSEFTTEWTNLHKIEAQMTRPGMMVVGQPGFGKSYLLKQMHDDDVVQDKAEKLAWTKTAALNIGGSTLDHMFPAETTRQMWIEKATQYDALSFDEFTIIPEKWWSLFLEIKTRKPTIRMRFFGDPQQLHSNDYGNSKLWFDYSKSDLMKFLVDGNRVQLEYLVATARYDLDMKLKLDSFETTATLAAFGDGKEHGPFPALFTPAECQFNIVKNPQKRTEINEEWVAHLSKGKAITRCGDMKLWVGMYLISHKNNGKIVNSTRYLVLSLGDLGVGLKEEISGARLTVTYDQIKNTCKYGYADTVMRVISRTIPSRFNIQESGRMDWNEMFVALSRASLAENIGIKYKADRVYVRASPPTGEEVKESPNLFMGYIYDRTDGINHYAGSTTNVEKRRAEHDAAPVSKKVEEWEQSVDKADIKMTVIEKFLCSSEKQLVRREYYHIARIPAEVCMNTNGICKAAVEKTKTAIAPVPIDYTRFKITDVGERKLFRIQWRESGESKSKEFSYKVKAKEDQLVAAEAFRAGLVKKFIA